MKRATAIITAIVLCLCILPMAAFAADDVTLYLKPNSNWLMDGARFAAYTWDIGDAWFDMTDSDNDGYYEVKVPANVSNIIFCRMNPSTTENNWNNKWNQTSDLVIPTDGGNCYTVADGTWDKGNGKWSVFGSTTPSEPEPEPDPVYVVAGSAGLCGSEWAATDEANLMTETSEGVYAITYKNVAAGDYELKVVKNGTEWIGGSDGNNVAFTVSEACDVTVTYSEADGIVVTGDHLGAPEDDTPTEDTPSTGDTPTTGDTTLFALGALMVLSTAAVVLLKKKEF